MNNTKSKEKDAGSTGRGSPKNANVHMHTTRSSRSRGICAGVYFRPHLWNFVKAYAETAGSNRSAIVNRALERFLSTRLAGKEAERLRLEAQRDHLIREERRLVQELKIILRSGAYLKEYAKRLLLGEKKEISRLRSRIGVYAHVTKKELNIILRILKRRKSIVEELLEIEDKLLPEDAYPFALSDKGWKIGGSIYSRNSKSRVAPKRSRRKKDEEEPEEVH